VIGAVAGGYGGKAAAEAIDPTVQDEYWEQNFKNRPYAASKEYNQYRPAYRYGWESRSRFAGKSFDEAAPDLERGWPTSRSESNLSWQDARPATRDAWDRVSPNAGQKRPQ